NDASARKNAENYYECICGKTYKHRQNLHIHKKKCDYTIEEEQVNQSLVELDNIDYKDLFLKMINENTELRKTMVVENQGLRDQISELIPMVGNHNNNKTINNKQRFNINIFLNEQCKDALTMNEFIDKIKVTMSDLTVTKDKGLSEGVSNIFIENMNKLSLHERPMHCTDVKRETVYIKCENEDTNEDSNTKWEKDPENKKLKKALKKISQKQHQKLDLWTEQHPKWMDNEALQREYIQLVKNCTDDLNEKKREEKVIKKLCNNAYLS
ncbi:unnamed protein product, partial [marine sediment metagenome]